MSVVVGSGLVGCGFGVLVLVVPFSVFDAPALAPCVAHAPLCHRTDSISFALLFRHTFNC